MKSQVVVGENTNNGVGYLTDKQPGGCW